MTDARLPGRWLMDPVMDALSDRAWRTFTGGLMWSNEGGSDGRIPYRSFRLLHPEGVDSATLRELIEAHLWIEDDDGVRVPDWDTRMGQRNAVDVERQREFNRQRQRKHRASRKAVTENVTRDVTRESLGQGRAVAGQGRALDSEGISERESASSNASEPVLSWPVTSIPDEGVAS